MAIGKLVGVGVTAATATVYCVLHSLLASDEAQAVARRVFGPGVARWYRLAYNALAIATLVPLDPLLAHLPDRTLYTLPAPWRAVTRLAGLGAFAGLAYCLWLTDAWSFLGIRQTGWLAGKPRRLVDTGPYGWVRHPSYWCLLGVLWAKPTLTVNQCTQNIVFTLYLGVGSFFSERRLVREFGPAYLAYRRRVPRLLPRWGLSRYRSVPSITAEAKSCES